MEAATEGSITEAGLADAIGKALAESAASAPTPLTRSDIGKIVRAAIPPTPTAVPVPTPTATLAPQPVVSRLIVAQVPPRTQSTMTHVSSYTGSGPLRGLEALVVSILAWVV